MDAEQASLLTRIAEALERLAPKAAPTPSFEGARLFRHEPGGGFVAAPDFPLPLDLLVGIDRQKTRFVENLARFAKGLPSNHALLWGVRPTDPATLAVVTAALLLVAALAALLPARASTRIDPTVALRAEE